MKTDLLINWLIGTLILKGVAFKWHSLKLFLIPYADDVVMLFESREDPRYIRIVKYWFKLLKQTKDCLTESVYNIPPKSAYRQSQLGHSLLRDMLFNFGSGEVCLNQGGGDENLFLAAFKQRIGDTYLQTWNQNINNNRKSILYKDF